VAVYFNAGLLLRLSTRSFFGSKKVVFFFGVVYRRRGHVDLADFFDGGDYDGDSVIVTATSKLSLGVLLLGVVFWW